jgi:hypothetical protein
MNLEQIANLILTRGAATADQIRGKSLKELEQILDDSLIAQVRAEASNSPEALETQQRLADIQADRQRQAEENQLTMIFRTAINDKVAIDNQAARNIIRGWLDESQGDTAITVKWFQKILNATPSLARQLSWKPWQSADERRQASAAQDAEEHRVFHDFCRDNGWSECAANLALIKSVLGNFDQYTLVQAVQSNALELAQASPEELEQFHQEKIELHNAHLLSLDLPALRKLAREAGARGQAPMTPDETQRIRAAEKVQNNQFQPLLPDSRFRGEMIDYELVQQLSPGDLKQLLRIYGSEAVNRRIAEWNSKVQPNLY